ncbi:MAG: superoxide dismutase [Chlamydiae bacterium]|nr:superoxide dismutase [Chlamydiota bacterium]
MPNEKFILPELGYDYSGLEPVFPAEALKIHHDKHHRGYVNNVNLNLEKFHEAEKHNDLTAMAHFMGLIKFNAGGHLIHSFFWENLAPQNKGGGEVVKKELFKAIEKDFQNFDKFVEAFNAQTIGVQGSGWGWLALNKFTKHLFITTSSNQDLLNQTSAIPLMCVDVWEHSYYIKYKNDRAQYVKDIWSIINWTKVEERFIKALK